MGMAAAATAGAFLGEANAAQASAAQAGDYVVEPERRINVRANVDVLVCGGGPAGIGAAIAAARTGAHTLLLENLGSLGGVGSNAIMNRLGPFHDQEKMIIGGIPMEILKGLVALDGAIMPRPVVWTRETNNRPEYWAPFDPEILKVLLDRMTEEAGVKLLFNTRVVGTIVNNGSVSGVFIESKSGREAVRAKIVIDATGDGDVAALAGAPYEKGRAEDGWTQPVSVLYKVHNLDREKARGVLAEQREKIIALARSRGENIPRFVTGGTDNFLRADETYYNEDQIHGADGTNVEHVTKAWIEARKMIWQEFNFNKKYVSGYEKAYVALTSSLLGVRETRRVMGEYMLNGEDVLTARKFPDAVYRYACYVDLHKVSRPGAPESAIAQKIPPPGTSYDVPYRCLVPKKTDNLLVAGRCFSVTHEALASARPMPSCMAMGQAAGTAAAMCADHGILPRKLDAAALRKNLIAQGVSLG
jgi:ribulose 1,5-bisphosphate synthetase/thiazole synthase